MIRLCRVEAAECDFRHIRSRNSELRWRVLVVPGTGGPYGDSCETDADTVLSLAQRIQEEQQVTVQVVRV